MQPCGIWQETFRNKVTGNFELHFLWCISDSDNIFQVCDLRVER